MAYVLGYIVADGCITVDQRREKNPFSLNITSKDEEHLYKIRLALKSEHSAIGDARGLGLMQALEFVDSAGNPDAAAALRVQQGAIDEGLLLLTCGALGNVVRIIPALIVSEASRGLPSWAIGYIVSDAISL